jgi:membrane-bound metal-dependent hydrolase YbcI (DUF457 family)
MPVIGHAFVGIITAHEFEPGGLRNPQPLRPLGRALWMPLFVGLAYLPDVATQLGLWMGYGSAKLAGHSIVFGALAGFLIALGWARVTAGSSRLLGALAIGSIVLHDLLDLLQATDRAPLWPITERVITAGWLALPSRMSSELLIFGLAYAVYEGWRVYLQRGSPAESQNRRPSGLILLGRSLVITLLATAIAIQRVRDERERQMDLAKQLLRSGHPVEALKAADAADRWPLSASPDRTDIVRGEAHEALGDNARAEMFYLRAYRSDPENFWALADLAEYYASHGTAAERRQRSAPYLEELRRRFSGNRSFRTVMDRVERTASKVP